MITLDTEWTRLLEDYRAHHADPRNQVCHAIGIPLIAGAVPAALTGLGLPLAAGMFAGGWAFQFLGHYFEGNDPAFFEDSRNLWVGLVWWLDKLGVPVETAETAKATGTH